MSVNTIPMSESVKVSKRDYLTEEEVKQLIETAKKNGRYGQRDALMILMSYRHGLRSIELVDITWDQINFKAGTILIDRAKRGKASTHPLSGDELRKLRALKRESNSPYVFTSERGSKMTTANVRQLFRKLRQLITIDGPIHAHALRHACGHQLANKDVGLLHIKDYLGHTDIRNTARYTELSSTKFKGFDKLI